MNATPTLTAAVLAATFTLGGGAAHAQDVRCAPGTFPCGLQVEELGVRPVPALLKLQARVSQAKLPVGEGTFDQVSVRVRSGTETVCKENFRDVQVRDGVLNLSIGENLDCDLSETLATAGDLSLQVCLSHGDECLPTIPLTPAAYAIKSGSAGLAQHAHEAAHAAQAHYAHRLAADRALATTGVLEAGYVDFETPAGRDDGHLAWVPARSRASLGLHLAQRTAAGQLSPLTAAMMAAHETRVDGRLALTPAPGTGLVEARVEAGGLHATGASSIDGTLAVTRRVTVDAGGTEVSQGPLDVTGDATVRGRLSTGAPLTVGRGLVVQTGGATVAAGGFTAKGTGLVTGAVTAQSRVAVTDRVLVSTGGLAVSTGRLVAGGAATFHDDVVVSGRMTAAGGLRVGVGGLVVSSGGLVVGGQARFDAALDAGSGLLLASADSGDLRASATVDAGRLQVGGDARIEGPATVRGHVALKDASRAAATPTVLAVTADARPVLRLGDEAELARVRVYPPTLVERGLTVHGDTGLGALAAQGVTVQGHSTFPAGATIGGAAESTATLRGGAIFTAADPASATTTVATATLDGATRLQANAVFDGEVHLQGPVRWSTQACPVGFAPNAEGRCDDIDECAAGDNPCDYDPYCVNLRGGYRCAP